MGKKSTLIGLLCICFILFGMSGIGVEAKTKTTLNKKNVVLYVGDTTTLKLKGIPNSSIKWVSSNKSIAKVNKVGKVTGKKKGKVYISAIYKNKKYKCKVEVKKPYLNKTKVKLKGGETVKLKLYGDTVRSYSSKNNYIAKVSSKGVISARLSGTTEIVVRGKSGKNYKCTVIVVNPYLNKTTVALDIGKSFQLVLNGAEAKEWISCDESVAVVDDKGKVTAISEGSATIMVKEASKRTYYCNVVVSSGLVIVTRPPLYEETN